MTEVSPSLLLAGASQPANGVAAAGARPWYGGDLSLIASGVFSGASVQLVMTINMPPNGKIPEDTSDWIEDADWIELGDAMTEPGRQEIGHVNPCMLAVKVASSASGTRVKVLLG